MEYIRFICLVGKRAGEVNKDALTIVTCNVKCQIVNSTQVAPGVKWPHQCSRTLAGRCSLVCVAQNAHSSVCSESGEENAYMTTWSCSKLHARVAEVVVKYQTLYFVLCTPYTTDRKPKYLPRHPGIPKNPSVLIPSAWDLFIDPSDHWTMLWG